MNFIAFYMLLHLALASNLTSSSSDDDDLMLISARSSPLKKKFEHATVKSLVKQHGYKIEEHKILTEDGYILTYHRVNAGKKGSMTPVLLQHGMGTSSAVFVTPNKNALGYVLADAGFDVWLANSRGNKYSMKHKSLNPSDKKFWNFSMHELATKDLPAAIDYILKLTHKPKLVLLGHSYGATQELVLAASKPAWVKKRVAAIVALAPTVRYERSALTTAFMEDIETMATQHELEGKYNIFDKKGSFIKESCLVDKKCKPIIEQVFGKSNLQTWIDIGPLEPSGTSTKFVHHVYQHFKQGKFMKQYDHGEHKNELAYRSASPPHYPFHKINVDLIIFYSHDDVFVAEEDIIDLTDKVKPHVKELYPIKGQHFNHLDFIWGPKAKNLVYKNVIKEIKAAMK